MRSADSWEGSRGLDLFRSTGGYRNRRLCASWCGGVVVLCDAIPSRITGCPGPPSPGRCCGGAPRPRWCPAASSTTCMHILCTCYALAGSTHHQLPRPLSIEFVRYDTLRNGRYSNNTKRLVQHVLWDLDIWRRVDRQVTKHHST